MAVGVDEYVQQILQLLPRGILQGIGERGEALFRRLFEAFADRFLAAHLRADSLLDETDPTLTNEALVDFERMLGIPGECGDLGTTIQQRRAAVLQKITDTGGQSRAYFIALAERFGHPGARIEEYDYFRAGDPAGSPVRGIARVFSWTLHTVEAAALIYFRAGQSVAGEPVVAIVGSDALECAIEQAKPAHTTVVFSYGSA